MRASRYVTGSDLVVVAARPVLNGEWILLHICTGNHWATTDKAVITQDFVINAGTMVHHLLSVAGGSLQQKVVSILVLLAAKGHAPRGRSTLVEVEVEIEIEAEMEVEVRKERSNVPGGKLH